MPALPDSLLNSPALKLRTRTPRSFRCLHAESSGFVKQNGDSSSKNIHFTIKSMDLAWVDLIKNVDFQKCGVRRNVPSSRGYAPYGNIRKWDWNQNKSAPRWRISYFAAVPKIYIYAFDHIVPVMLQISKIIDQTHVSADLIESTR